MVENNIDRYQQEAERFISIFSSFKDKKIVLYGIGRFTSTLVPRVRDNFNIVGLMDRDVNNIGKTIFGLPIISLTEAESSADCIIINTTSTYWQTIYNRIINSKIPVFFLNGEEAGVSEVDENRANNPYWDVCFADYKNIASDAEIISFDLFDTLIQRTCYLSSDVYLLASEIINNKLGTDIDYACLRQQVRGELPPNYTWEELAEKLNKIFGMANTKVMLDAELEAEMRLCVPRKSMCNYLNELINKGKDVYIITDTYLPKDFILKLLKKMNLGCIKENKILVSNEVGKSKSDGTLWRYFADSFIRGKKAVHFGDNEVSDIKMAKKVGVIPCYIMNSRTMLANSNISSIGPQVRTLYESVVVGLVLSRLFDSPFTLNKTKGIIALKTCGDIGYAVYAPLIVTFLIWLLAATKQAGMEHIYFFARDGFFLEKDYRFLCNIFKDDRAPKAHYLYISRQAVWIASISSEEDFDIILSQPYVGTFKNYMKSRWDIEVDTRTVEMNNKNIDTFLSTNELKNTMFPYMDEIKDKIRKDRENYILYLRGLNIDEYCGFVDQGIHGTIQLYLSKILGHPIKSWNVVAQEDVFSDGNEQKSCYRGPDKSGYFSPLAENLIFIETFLTAPYGMIRRVDARGNRVSDEPSKGQKYFKDKEVMNSKIEQFMWDIAQIFGSEPVVSSIEREFMADLLLTIYQGGTMFDREAVRSFIYENPTMHIGESSVFD